MLGGKTRDPDPRRLDGEDLGHVVVLETTVELAPEFRDEGNVDLMVDKSVHLQDVARFDLPVLQNPLFKQFHSTFLPDVLASSLFVDGARRGTRVEITVGLLAEIEVGELVEGIDRRAILPLVGENHPDDRDRGADDARDDPDQNDFAPFDRTGGCKQ